tara:strand:+ start:246 stop:713 length:468 start_codon:yes stop_codon:yes gene_type:complete
MSRVVVNEIQAKVGNDISFNDAAKIDTLKGKTTAGSIIVQGEGTNTTNLQQGLVKAWYNFSPNNSNSYRDSFNITDVTDNGTGDFTHNFTNNMNNDDFSFTTGTNGNNNEGVNSYNSYYDPDTVASSSVTSRNISSGGTAQDTYYILGMVAGDLS